MALSIAAFLGVETAASQPHAAAMFVSRADLSTQVIGQTKPATHPGDPVLYLVLVHNAGPFTATNVRLEVTVKNLAVAKVAGACAKLSCRIERLAPDADARLIIRATVQVPGISGVRSEVHAAQLDPTPSNNVFEANVDAAAPQQPPPAAQVATPVTPAAAPPVSTEDKGSEPPSVVDPLAAAPPRTGTSVPLNPGLVDAPDVPGLGLRADSSADLSVSATGPETPARPGEQVSYDLSIRNAGPGRATGVDLAIRLKDLALISTTGACRALRCRIAKLDPGEVTDVMVQARVRAKGDFGLTATVFARQPDPSQSDNRVEQSTPTPTTWPAAFVVWLGVGALALLVAASVTGLRARARSRWTRLLSVSASAGEDAAYAVGPLGYAAPELRIAVTCDVGASAPLGAVPVKVI